MATFFYPTSDNPNGLIRPLSVLPAAGAYDPSPTVVAAETYNELVFLISYLDNGTGGAVGIKVEFSDDNVTWFQTSHLNPPTTFTPGSESVFGLQHAVMNFVTEQMGVTQYFLTPSFTVAARWCRISLRETGNPGTPGQASVRVQLRGQY